MRKGWIVYAATALALAAGPAAAQTPPPAPGGAFEQLSPGNQKIARAVFESQQFSPTAPKPLSLDQIAGLKQSGRGWGVVYKDLQAKGLVTDRNLGQAVSRFNHEQKSAGPTSVEITTGSGKTVSVGSAGRSGSVGSSRRSFSGDEDEHGNVTASARSGQGNSPGGGGDGATSARGGGASHGGGRGK